MARDLLPFYQRFIIAFLVLFNQSERHLHRMSTDTKFVSIVKDSRCFSIQEMKDLDFTL